MNIYSADIKGIKKVIQMIEKKKKQFDLDDNPRPTVAVGYTQNYALYVHENMEYSYSLKNVKAGRGAKYLETPARLYRSRIAQIIKEAIAKKTSLAKSLMKGGLFLQRESMKLVPIDTGALRASAYTRLE